VGALLFGLVGKVVTIQLALPVCHQKNLWWKLYKEMHVTSPHETNILLSEHFCLNFPLITDGEINKFCF
jgi:hypothetical protein